MHPSFPLILLASSLRPCYIPHLIARNSSFSQLGTLYNGGSAVYDISDLDAGTLYYVRVSAVSSVGTSDSTLAANNPVAPSQHPDAPADMAAEAVIGSGVVVNSEIEVGVEIVTVVLYCTRISFTYVKRS